MIFRHAARLQRIRAENRAGRVVDGLGAANLPFTRSRASEGWAATVGNDAVQAEGSAAALGRFDAQSAAADARQDAQIAKFNAKLERLSGNVRKMEAAWAAGPGGGYSPGNPLRRQSLAGRLKGKGFGIERSGQIEVGPVQIGGPGLIGLSTKFIRGGGGRIFATALATRVASAGLQGVASATESMRALQARGASFDELSRAGALGFGRSVRDTVASTFGLDDAAASIATIIGGKSQAENKAAIEKFVDDLFTTREEKSRRKQAKDAALLGEFQAINDSVEKQWRKIDTSLPQTFRATDVRTLRRFRQESREANEPLFKAQADLLKDRAARVAEGN